MDGRTQFSRVMKMLEPFDKKNLSMSELRNQVSMHISSNTKTLDNTIKLMFDVGMIIGIDATHVKVTLGDIFK